MGDWVGDGYWMMVGDTYLVYQQGVRKRITKSDGLMRSHVNLGLA
jgi:hypothetical protein